MDAMQHSQSYSPFTLRFHDRVAEGAFTARQKGKLVRRMKTIILMVIITSTVGLTVNVVVHKHHQPASSPTHIAYASNKVSLLCFLGMVIGLSIILVSLCCEWLVAKISPVMLEVYLSWAMVVVMLMAVVCSPGHIAQMQGYSLKQAFNDKYFSDSRILMMIDAGVTALHIGVPMRWCSLFPIQVMAVLLYVAVIWLIGGSEPLEQSLHNLIFLTALVVAASVGKRAAEEGEREAFKDIIKEKSLRCEAEFQLQRATEAAAQSQRQLEEAKPTMPGTSVGQSENVFSSLHHESCSDRVNQLSRIAQMGDAEHWLINRAEVKILPDDILGIGGFAVVSRGYFCGIQVAVKRPRHGFDDSPLKELPNLCNELRIMRHLKHPNVVATHGAIVDPREHQIAIVLELVEGVTLRDLMAEDTYQAVSLLARFRIMVGVCRALLYMHTRLQCIVHGDLKSSNIMIQGSGEEVHPKLLDFGMSRVITQKARPLGGSLAWAAPEVLKGKPMKCSSDIYSFGRVIALLATGKSLGDQFDPPSIRHALKEGRSLAPVWPKDCVFEPSCRPLVKSCLSISEEQRPSISHVYSVLLELPRHVSFTEQGDFLTQLAAVAANWEEGCQQEPKGPVQGPWQDTTSSFASATTTRLVPVAEGLAEQQEPQGLTTPSGPPGGHSAPPEQDEIARVSL